MYQVSEELGLPALLIYELSTRGASISHLHLWVNLFAWATPWGARLDRTEIVGLLLVRRRQCRCHDHFRSLTWREAAVKVIGLRSLELGEGVSESCIIRLSCMGSFRWAPVTVAQFIRRILLLIFILEEKWTFVILLHALSAKIEALLQNFEVFLLLSGVFLQSRCTSYRQG